MVRSKHKQTARWALLAIVQRKAMQEEAIIPLRLTTHLGRHYIVRTVQTGPKDYLTTAAWRHDWGRIKIIFQYPTHSEEEARRKHQEVCAYCIAYGVKDNEA